MNDSSTQSINPDSIQVVDPNYLAVETPIFISYLKQFGLPTNNIIASNYERSVIANNLPSLVSSLPVESRAEARYLSKFIGATAIGLFDAALNYVWNEVVLNLRKKVVLYGVELFFDAAVGGKNRESYSDVEDLSGLKDIVLLNTCRKLELISDVVYRKLDFILTMRNEVAASHPNVESIGGYELLGWLQTCIKEVLQDKPSASAIRINQFVSNLKSKSEVIDESAVARMKQELKNLTLAHVNNLLVTIFGIFTSPESGQVLRKNISLIASIVWECSSEQTKTKISELIDGYRNNLNDHKLDKGIEFLKIVDGLNYESLPEKTSALLRLASSLEEAHEGWDNFYNEPPIMREILQYCHSSKDIPSESLSALTRVVLRCRIGNGVSYKQGVSPAGLPLYEKFLYLLNDEGIALIIQDLFLPIINARIRSSICQSHLKSVLEILKAIAISERLIEIIDFLLNDIKHAYHAHLNKEFREKASPLVSLPPLPSRNR